jgi:hypothetical protein
MKHIVFGLLFVVACVTARAQDSVLPQDFFISSFGKLRDTTEVKELTHDSFEIRQHFQKRTTEGEQLNFMTFCVASAIAVQRKFNGWSLSMQFSDDTDATSRVLTLALLNSEDEAKKLPTANHWLPYRTPAQVRATCSHFVNVKYLWPESSSSTSERSATSLPRDVGTDETSYPIVNPNPTHKLTLTGVLPANQPINDVELLYETDVQSDDKGAEQCRRPSPFGPKLPADSLLHKVVLPLTRGEDKYQASFFVDQYLPGRCHWHLTTVTYRLRVNGFTDPMRIQHGISAVNPEHYPKLADFVRAQPDRGARMELWCLNPPKYIPVSCTDFGDFAAHVLSAEQRASVPAIQREDANAAYILPDSTDVQVNFHDLSATAAAKPTQP